MLFTLLLVCAGVVVVVQAERPVPTSVASTTGAGVGRAAPSRTAPADVAARQQPAAQVIRRRVQAESDLHVFELVVTVIDRTGLPDEGQWVFVAPRRCALNRWPEPTGEDGATRIRWRARAAAMPVVVALQHVGNLLGMQDVVVRAGEPVALTLVRDEPVRCTGPLWPASQERKFLPGCASCHSGREWLDTLNFAVDAPREILREEVAFADRAVLDVDAFGPRSSFVGTARGWCSSRPVEGVVLDGHGFPAPGVRVSCSHGKGWPVGRTRTNAKGAFYFGSVPIGSVMLRAGGEDLGLAMLELHTGSVAAMRHVELRLEKGACIRGRALADDGRPLGGCSVEFVADDGRHADLCTVGDDGSFELPNQPLTTGTLMLTRHAGGLPIAFQRGVAPAAAELRLDLAATGAAGSVTLRVRTEPHARIDARAWHVATGRGVPLWDVGEGRLAVLGLAAGRYRIAVGTDGSPWLDLGERQVDGRSCTDLGEIVPPAPAELVLERGAAPLPALPELYARRAWGDLLAEHRGALAGDRIPLPAGAWRLVWRPTSGGPLRSHDFEVAPAARVSVQLR